MKEQISKILVLSLLLFVAFGCPTALDEKEDFSMAEEREGWETNVEFGPGEPLSADVTEALLARLPDLDDDEADVVDFKRRAESMRPPLTGEDIEGDWPPDLSNPSVQSAPGGSLKVQAFRPTGEVTPPFQVAIAFDRPVVKLGAVGTQAIPELELSPAVDGRWRWLGTQSLVFEPTENWPMATEFEVELASGLESVDGSTLDEALNFAFTTPAPEVEVAYPRGTRESTTAPVGVVFNQAIDERTVDSISVTIGGQEVPMEVLTGESRAEAAQKWRAKKANEQGRLIALKPTQAYPTESTVSVEVDGPIVSAEGPVVGMEGHQSTFEVHGAFEFTEISCYEPCRPNQGFQLIFSNPIDPEDKDFEVSAEPSVDDISAELIDLGGSILVYGDFKPNTTYTITVSDGPRDIFGQEIAGTRSRTVEIGNYEPMVAGPNQSLLVRPSTAAAQIPIWISQLESLRVRIYDVDVDDWEEFGRIHSDSSASPSLSPVETMELNYGSDDKESIQEILIDLSAAVGEGETGHAMVFVDNPSPWRRWGSDPRWVYWVQMTDLAVDLSSDHESISALVTSIADGSMVEGVEFQINGNDQGVTDSRGEQSFPVPRAGSARSPLIAKLGGDSLIIPVNGQTRWFGGRSEWTHRSATTDLLWHVVDDRQMYKPGETVNIRGWKRLLERSPHSDLSGLGDGETVEYMVRGPRRNEIARGRVDVDAHGGFELDFEIPEGSNLGTILIQMTSSVATTSSSQESSHHTVQVQEFRRPEYEVTLSTDEGPHQVDNETVWEGEAAYYAGGAVTGAASTWRFSESSASYQPAGWQGWAFGAWNPWWSPWGRGVSHSGSDNNDILPEEFKSARESTTDGRGQTQMAMTFNTPERGLPRRVSGTLSVTDVNRQTWEGTESVLVHPADVYIGLRSEKNFIHRDEDWEVEVAVVDIDGEEVAGRPIHLDLKHRRGSDMESVDECTATSTAESTECIFSDLSPGAYQVVAIVEDERGRSSESELNFWVAGQDRSGAQTAEEDELIIIPDSDSFASGDRAELFVQAPYYPMEAVVEIRRDGLYDRRRVTLTEEDSVVEVDIEEAMIPNVHVKIMGIGQDGGYRPENFAAGQIMLNIDPGPRELTVSLEPGRDVIGPGETLDVGLQVKDSRGEPVENAQVLLYAVDESVLALSSYELLNPISSFYPTRIPGMSDVRSRSWLLLDSEEEELAATPSAMEREPRRRARSGAIGGAQTGEPQMMMMESGSPMGGEDGPSINIREVFDALAFYRSDLITDGDGRISVTEQMPDSLTRYRIMAVAIDDRHFGTAEEDVTAMKPLMVRPSPPRFLNVDDAFGFPVVVHNRTSEDMVVDVALRATAGLEFPDFAGRRVRIPSEDRVEVKFPARATSAGDTRVQVVAAGVDHSDAEFASFPVLTPATTEAFATYGSIGADDDDAVLQALRVPDDAYAEFGGLDVSTSSTQLQALTDAFLYLTTYRFNSSEHLASRILSVLALYDVLDAFDAPDLPAPAELEEALATWTEQLLKLQHADGGFKFWTSSKDSSPFGTVHATLAISKAKDAGQEVPSGAITRADRYISNISQHLTNYHPRSAATVEAYALHVRDQMGQAAPRDLDNLLGRVGIEEMSIEGLGWLLPMAAGTQWEERFLQRITGQVQETAATAEFQESFSTDAHRVLHTTRRTDGVVLDGLMQVDPDHPLIEKVARGLLAHRSRGRWANTQENVFILMALRTYFDTYESVEPDFVSRAWLGDDQIAEHAYKGRSTDRHSVSVPMNFLQQGAATQPFVVQRDGLGRMYYRMGIRYAPKSRMMPPLSEGFTVERNYEAIDDEDDVRRVDGGWEVQAGARVRVELTMTIPARRYHVALVDWIPAGFEPINTALDVSAVESGLTGGSRDARRWGWWGLPWFQHQNMRDERVEAFSSLVSEGIHTYSYVARATTPGEFVAMPAKAEEMYHPETFGRSGTEVVRVVEE